MQAQAEMIAEVVRNIVNIITLTGVFRLRGVWLEKFHEIMLTFPRVAEAENPTITSRGRICEKFISSVKIGSAGFELPFARNTLSTIPVALYSIHASQVILLLLSLWYAGKKVLTTKEILST